VKVSERIRSSIAVLAAPFLVVSMAFAQQSMSTATVG